MLCILAALLRHFRNDCKEIRGVSCSEWPKLSSKLLVDQSFLINSGFLNPLCEVCRSCIYGSRGLEMKQLFKSKPAAYGRDLLISLATAQGEQQGTVVCDQSPLVLWVHNTAH